MRFLYTSLEVASISIEVWQQLRYTSSGGNAWGTLKLNTARDGGSRREGV
jgi:hypothetical protein